MGPCGNQINVFALTLAKLGKLLHQLGIITSTLFQQLIDLRPGATLRSITRLKMRYRLRPGQLTQHQRPDHAPAFKRREDNRRSSASSAVF